VCASGDSLFRAATFPEVSRRTVWLLRLWLLWQFEEAKILLQKQDATDVLRRHVLHVLVAVVRMATVPAVAKHRRDWK